MKIFDKLSPERQEEYWRRIRRVKEAHPDTYFPSYYHHIMSEVDMMAAKSCLTAQEAFNCAVWPFCFSGIPASAQRYASDALLHAAALGDTEKCEFLYKELWADIDKKNSDGETPLLKAVQRKRLGTAEWLLRCGAKISTDKKGWNPVLVACYEACIPALNMFKYHGVDFNQPYSEWRWEKGLPKKRLYYPIELAIFSKHPKAPDAVQWLLDNGVSIDNKKERGYFSVRELFQENPESLSPEIRQILRTKIAQTPAPVQKSQRGSLSCLQQSRVKD